MRATRLLFTAAAGLVVAAAAGSLLALAASTLRGTAAARPRTSVCAGTTLRVDRLAKPLGILPFRARIFDPDDRLVWVARRKHGAPQKPWRFRTRRAGSYQIVFQRGSRAVPLDVLVTTCSRQLSLMLNDRERAMFRLSGIRPGSTREACVRVTYAGNRPAHVRLWGTTNGTGLDRFLRLTVTRGWTARDVFPSCRSFRPDRTSYLGLGAGVIYAGTLEGMANRWEDAPDDVASGFPLAWRRGQTHAYRLTVTLPRAVGNAAQGLTAERAFTWEARGRSLACAD